MPTTHDRIEKEITLDAAPERVWRALTDPAEFGEWFGVVIEGAFEVGQQVQGRITTEGCEHMRFMADIVTKEPNTTFAYRWRPHAMDPNVDYSRDPSTLVEFKLRKVGEGTLLTVIESGFDGLPAEDRVALCLRNEGGWNQQILNIQKHVSAS